MTKIRTITPEYVDDLIDFAPTKEITAAGIGQLQRDGSVALFNMLSRNGVAYLADEVGMGKTYIGLAVMSLLRYQKTDARVLVLTPRRNIQEKWAADLQNFVRYNWRRADHRVKTPQGSPDFPVRVPDRIADWINDLHDQDIGSHDTILRMTSFSLGTDDGSGETIERFKSYLNKDVRPRFAHLKGSQSREQYAGALRSVLKAFPYDLIIVDEAHNLKYGFSPQMSSSIRNEVMYHLFGDSGIEHRPWLLMLSATPMENGDPQTLVRQFEIFGRTNRPLAPAPGEVAESFPLSALAGEGEQGNFKILRERQKRLIVRRVGELRLPDQTALTRNMYRREWRAGGVDSPDLPMAKPSRAVRLVNAVLQKNVFDLLQANSGGRFRIGALESFEIYSGRSSAITDLETTPQSATDGAPDQHVIARLGESFREAFDDEVPHPKLNAVSALLSEHLAHREKALVFVRRVATTWDLATRVSYAFDEELSSHLMRAVQPSDLMRVKELLGAWASMRSKRQFEDAELAEQPEESDSTPHIPIASGEDDAAGEDVEDDAAISEVVPSLFTWFFRGEQRGMAGFTDIYAGRRLREQLEARSRLCLLLEENYVDWLLARPQSILEHLEQTSGIPRQQILDEMCQHLPASIMGRGNIRRQFHAVQFAALTWILNQGYFAYDLRNVGMLLDVLYPNTQSNPAAAADADISVLAQFLETRGLYPELARAQRQSPLYFVVARGVFEDVAEKADFDFRQALRRREHIRLLQMALLRHGAPLVDLYFATLDVRDGVFTHAEGDNPPNVGAVAQQLVKVWSESASDPARWRACGGWELAEVNGQFDLIKKLNLHDLDQYAHEDRPLDFVFVEGPEPASDNPGQPRSARRLLNQELAGQAPTAAAQGGQSDERRHRLTTQFRMPGMPWVLVATSVYEEGVDLHTYCRTIIHHGISHSASSVEQRTGRVDRIGGQVQRSVANLSDAGDFTPDVMIQSLFPYQSDTFEKHQVRRVLHNCNRFLQSLHDTEAPIKDSHQTDLLDKRAIPKQITERLQSPFDVSNSSWLFGELTTPDRRSDFDRERYLETVIEFELLLRSEIPNVQIPDGQGLERRYQIDDRVLYLTPHSHREGDAMLLKMRVQSDEDQPEKFSLECNSVGTGWASTAVSKAKDMLKAS